MENLPIYLNFFYSYCLAYLSRLFLRTPQRLSNLLQADLVGPL